MIDEQRYRALIQQLATGGITGNKTYHQYHDQFVPIDSEGAGYANGGGVGSMMKPKRGLVNEPGGYAGYYGGGADYIGLNPENAPIQVEDLTVEDNDGNFLITAANALENQDGIIGASTNIMEPGVKTIEGSLIPGDKRMDFADARRAMTQPGFTDQATVYDPYGIRVEDGRFSYDMNKTSVDDFKPSWQGYEDLIQYPDGNPNAGNWLRIANNIDNEKFNEIKGINFIDAPIEKWSNRENHPMKGLWDKNVAYKALNDGTPESTAKWLTKKGYELPENLKGIDTNKKSFNLFDLSPTKAIFEGIAGMLPEMDPRQVALRDFYGYDNKGSVPAGLMKGYNPVSGGFLNTLTGGKFGKEPTYGLQKAYDKRINTINKTLAKWEADEDKYADKLKNTTLYSRRKALEEAKAAELAMLNQVKKDQAAAIIKQKKSNTKTSGGDNNSGWTSAGHYGKKQGTTGSWTPGGSYTSPSPKGYSSRSHSGGSYGGAHHWADGGIISLKR